MRDIRCGVLGEIIAGREKGRFVEVIDDSEGSGGYLVVTYASAQRSADIFDFWLESIVDVEIAFDECEWEINWL